MAASVTCITAQRPNLNNVLSRLFSRVQNPQRFFRFHKTALVLAGLSWVPFGYGLYTGATVVKDTVENAVAVEPDKPIAVVFKESVRPADAPSKFGSSVALIAGSYIVGYGAMGYYAGGIPYRPENPALRWVRAQIPWRAPRQN